MGHVKNGVINSGEIASATWLVFFGFEGEGVYVRDTVGLVFSATVVLVSLDFSEVFTFSAFEAVVSVKLEESIVDGDVFGSIVDSPYEFFYRVVEAEFVLSACATD